MRPLLLRVLVTVLATLFVAFSLLVFPQGVPWLAGAWLALYALFAVLGANGALVLAALLAVLLVKRIDWPPQLFFLGVLAGLVAAVETGFALRGRRLPKPGPRVLALGVAWLLALVEGTTLGHATRRVPFDLERPIVCLGDSLSAGGWARVLAPSVRVPVIDFSEPGLSAKQNLKLLPRVRALRPQVLVIELGGHDFLHGDARAETRSRLERLIGAGEEVGAQVILFEIPRGFIMDGYAGLERELAREHDLELIPDGCIRSLVLWSKDGLLDPVSHEPPLSDDGLHPNANGHRFLCEHVRAALERLYGDAFVKKPG